MIRVTGGINILFIAVCGVGAMDNATNHNPYTGYGAILFLQLVAPVVLIQLIVATVDTARKNLEQLSGEGGIRTRGRLSTSRA